MNVEELNKKFQGLQNLVDKCYDGLRTYINDALDAHSDEFVMKPEGCNSWEERSKQDCFNAMDELPYYVLIAVEDDNAHEIHISRVTRTHKGYGWQVIEVDGWDWSENSWVCGWNFHGDLESLFTVATFINAVLEQESERKIAAEKPFDYWDIVSEWLPNYSSRNDVLRSDILTRYTEGEEVSDDDLEWLPRDIEQARDELDKLDDALFNEAVNAMISHIDWVRYKQDVMGSIKNERLWGLGGDSEQHESNAAELEKELQWIEDEDFHKVLEQYEYRKEIFKDFMK